MTGILAVVAQYHKGQTLPPASGTTHMLRGTIRINRSVLAVLFVPDFCQVLGADDATYSKVDNVSKCLVAFLNIHYEQAEAEAAQTEVLRHAGGVRCVSGRRYV